MEILKVCLCAFVICLLTSKSVSILYHASHKIRLKDFMGKRWQEVLIPTDINLRQGSNRHFHSGRLRIIYDKVRKRSDMDEIFYVFKEGLEVKFFFVFKDGEVVRVKSPNNNDDEDMLQEIALQLRDQILEVIQSSRYNGFTLIRKSS